MSIDPRSAWVSDESGPPVQGAPAPVQGGHAPVQGGHAPAQQTILVVDDDDGVRLLMEAVLTDSGYHVLTADAAEAALDVAARHQGDIGLLVTDVRMPGMSGPALAGRMRAIYADLRVLFVSGLPDQAALRECDRDDDVQMLRKPFSPADMAARVARLLGLAETPRYPAHVDDTRQR